MKRLKEVMIVFTTVVVGLSAAPAQALSAPLYRIKDLGTAPGYTMSQANGLSSNGLVAGFVQNASDFPKAAIFQNNTTSVYDSLPSLGYDVNANGLATGFALNSQNKIEAATFENGSTNLLGVLPGEEHSTGVSINDSGAIVGISGHGSDTSDPTEHAVLFQNNSLVNLGALPGHNSSWAVGINNVGIVSGTSFDQGSQVYNVSKAVIYKDGDVIPIGNNNDCYSFGRGINDAIQVAGVVEDCNHTQKPVIFSGTQTIYLPLPDGDTEGEASAINNSGMVVGSSAGSDSQYHASLYTSGSAYKLSDLVSNISGWTLQGAFDVNDRGQIVGLGYRNGQQRAFLLTPILLSNLLSQLGLPPASLPPILP